MRSITVTEAVFDVASTNNTAGAPKDVSRFNCADAAVQCQWTSGSFDLQGTIDGTNWVNIQAAIGASMVVTLTHYWRALRIRTATAGTFTAHLGAHELLY